MSLRDRLQRRVVPRLVVRLSTVHAPARMAAAVRRALGGTGSVRLFVAFDDPYSAVAVLGLAERLSGRRAQLLIEPVVARGIPGDPAVEAKRRYAVVDSARLARRDGLELSRTESVSAEQTAFLAERAAAIPQGPERAEFCAAAMRRLWLQTSGPVTAVEYDDLGVDQSDVDGSERAMKRAKLYDTPVAVVAGQWFFAHERLDQVAERLDQLGWRAGA